MKLGNIDPQVSIDYDTTEKIFETTVTGSAVTSIDITGLSGNTDEQYMLDCNIVNGYDGGMAVNVRCNGDSGTNYGRQELYGSSTTIGASRATSTHFFLTGATSSGNVGIGTLLLHAKSGHVRTAINSRAREITGTTVTNLDAIGQSWNNTADEITSLGIETEQPEALGVGTSISLYRKVSAA